MKQHAIGARRDRIVLDTLAEWGTMDTDQLRLLFYPSTRVAQRRLKILSGKGKVKRVREAIELPYMYSIGKPDTVRLALNWLRIWILKRLRSWEVIDSFDYGTNTCTIRNTVAGTIRTLNVLYNVMKKTWLSGDTIIVYDTDDQRREAAKRIKGELMTIEEIKEGLKCQLLMRLG